MFSIIINIQGSHLLWIFFPKYSIVFHNQSISPTTLLLIVWALMFSLAATNRITFVFFSSGYLDVSVLQVPFNLNENEYQYSASSPIRKFAN